MKTIATKAAEAIYQAASEDDIRNGRLEAIGIVTLENESGTTQIQLTIVEWDEVDLWANSESDVITDAMADRILEYLNDNNLL